MFAWVADAPRYQDSTGLARWTAAGPAIASPVHRYAQQLRLALVPLHPFRHRVNRTESEGRTYDQTSCFDGTSKPGILGQEPITGVDHVDVVLDRDLDDLVAGEVSTDGGVLPALPDLVGLIGLLPVHAEAVLMTVDCDCVQRQLVGGTEDSDGDLSSVGDWTSC